jgi:cytidylate kinase
VKYRILTVSREFGSGGGRIANTIAGWLGWKLLDNEIILQIARAARVDSKVVRQYDERVDSWLRRLNEDAIRGVALAAGRPLGEEDFFDAQLMHELTRKIIEEAYLGGNCVIVGRGSQCLLQHRPDVFSVFVSAPFRERVQRLRTRLEPGADIESRIRRVDEERARYIRQHFSKSWCDPHLYNLMIRSCEDEDVTARILFYAMTGSTYSAPAAPERGASASLRS